jgi:hypothetical protein
LNWFSTPPIGGDWEANCLPCGICMHMACNNV